MAGSSSGAGSMEDKLDFLCLEVVVVSHPDNSKELPLDGSWRAQFEYQRPEWPYQASEQMITKAFWPPGSPTYSEVKSGRPLILPVLYGVDFRETEFSKELFIKITSNKYRKNGWITELPRLLSPWLNEPHHQTSVAAKSVWQKVHVDDITPHPPWRILGKKKWTWVSSSLGPKRQYRK